MPIPLAIAGALVEVAKKALTSAVEYATNASLTYERDVLKAQERYKLTNTEGLTDAQKKLANSPEAVQKRKETLEQVMQKIDDKYASKETQDERMKELQQKIEQRQEKALQTLADSWKDKTIPDTEKTKQINAALMKAADEVLNEKHPNERELVANRDGQDPTKRQDAQKKLADLYKDQDPSVVRREEALPGAVAYFQNIGKFNLQTATMYRREAGITKEPGITPLTPDSPKPGITMDKGPKSSAPAVDKDPQSSTPTVSVTAPAQTQQAKLTVDTPKSTPTPGPAVITQPAKPAPVTVTKPETEKPEEKPETKRERQHAQPIGPERDEDSFKFTIRMLFRTLLSAGATVGALAEGGVGLVLATAGALTGNRKLMNKGWDIAKAGGNALYEEHKDNIDRFLGVEVPVDKKKGQKTPESTQNPVNDQLIDRLKNAEAQTVRLQQQQVGKTTETRQFQNAKNANGTLQQRRQALDAKAQAQADALAEQAMARAQAQYSTDLKTTLRPGKP